MEKLQVVKDTITNLPGFSGGDARIIECANEEQFAQWSEGITSEQGNAMACRYENQVYVKTPKSLGANGEFSLDYDCLLLEEANSRIEQWNREQPS